MKRIKKDLIRIANSSDKLISLSECQNNGFITVSIHCFVYNQEKYISRCINSFLNQLVNFNVEILVHDDCSNDKSKEIIDKFYKKYPRIIRPFYEEKNVYSKTGNFLEIARFLNGESRGEYIAICEGDDYWTDPFKLFFQVSLLNKYRDCSFCVHRVNVESANDNYKICNSIIPSFKMFSQIIKSNSFITLVQERYNFQTSSYFFRKSDYDVLFERKPLYSILMPTDDEVLLRHFGSLGNTVFIDKTMSTYLQFTEGSWSKQHKDKKDLSKIERYLEAINEFDKYTDEKYHKSCKRLILRTKLYQLVEAEQFDTIFSDRELKKTLRSVDFKTYLSLRIRRFLKKSN